MREVHLRVRNPLRSALTADVHRCHHRMGNRLDAASFRERRILPRNGACRRTRMENGVAEGS